MWHLRFVLFLVFLVWIESVVIGSVWIEWVRFIVGHDFVGIGCLGNVFIDEHGVKL